MRKPLLQLQLLLQVLMKLKRRKAILKFILHFIDLEMIQVFINLYFKNKNLN